MLWQIRRLCSVRDLVPLLALIVVLSVSYSDAAREIHGSKIKTSVFLSPAFELEPGLVLNKYYHNIDFPKGHIAVKSFNAEVVDERGYPIPLHETYLHHWVVLRYFLHKDASEPEDDSFVNNLNHNHSDSIIVRNSGICQRNVLGQYYGLGSETRKTSTHVPDPFGVEVGNSKHLPPGYEERWMLNLHAIDTRGAIDRLGCTECRCDLYNITKDEYGRPLSPNYRGGLLCCYDHTQCRVRDGFEGGKRKLYLRYTIKWIDWDNFIVPVKIYIFDVTDTGKRRNGSQAHTSEHQCVVEYDVESSSSSGVAGNECSHVKRTVLTMPSGGYVIYGVAHQHTGGTGSTLYREDGGVICSSIPVYGKGNEAGNEDGYIVGMSTCYPQPGSVKIADGETLILESKYNCNRRHTGVMGLFYIMVAEQLSKPLLPLDALLSNWE